MTTITSTTEWIDYAEWRDSDAPSPPGDLRVLPVIAGSDRRPGHLIACLPPSHATAERRFPVLYMHDGQNLFDAATSFAGSWEVGRTVELLAAEGLEVIVIGVPHAGPQRLHEFSPFPDRRHGGGGGDAYLEFLADTVKPLVDRSFHTRPEREHTGLAGSSMGGLISLCGGFGRSDVFGLAAALSPSLLFGGDAALTAVEQSGGRPSRLYLDVGTREASHLPQSRLTRIFKSRRYVRRVRRMRNLLLRLGYRLDEDLLYVEDPGAVHNEATWARRLPAAIRFLFGPR